MKDLLDFAVRIAHEAGALTLRYFRAPDLDIERKADDSPVTRADKGAEELPRDRIRAACPDDGIVGEEFGEDAGTSGRRWILDPVDGTRSFVRGVPLYGTLVALEEEGRAVLGVIHMPALFETVYAASGVGAQWRLGDEARPARVSSTASLNDALLSTTSVGGFERAGRLEVYEGLRARVQRDRGWSDCYGHLLVATGRVDVMVDPLMAEWDCAALQPVVEGAGGRFTSLAGVATHRGGSAVSTNGLLHDAVLELSR